MKVVFDTNVLIAAFISHGTCAELLEYCICKHILVTSEAILREFREKLVQKFKFTHREAKDAEHLLRMKMYVVNPHLPIPKICRDPDDDVIIATALAGDCACIISGDLDLLDLKRVEDVDMISPSGFWKYEAKS
jgi:putative PIN family toxin of toxin-antitoxin system